MTQKNSTFATSTTFSDTKPHYLLLDGLRGVAALMVVWYHIFEGFAFAGGTAITTFNHGYLGVDFFFILSGFVISYAYDDRWKDGNKSRLTLGNFFKRRLIRLHPMLIMGAIIGTATFLIQGGVNWNGEAASAQNILLALVLTMLFIPAFPGASYDIRGNGEMFPLNGPSWSLFFEYIGNIIYALILRRLNNRNLFILTFIIGILWGVYVITDVSQYDMIGVGWTLDKINFCGGLLRMLFPLSIGMLIARTFKPVKVKGIFWISTLVLFCLFSVPYIAKTGNFSLNGIFELCCTTIIFPIIVWLAASAEDNQSRFNPLYKFLGNLSYPLYIVHYPIMYLFYAWLIENKVYTLAETWPIVILVICASVTLAYATLKLYDEPVRRFLLKKFNKR